MTDAPNGFVELPPSWRFVGYRPRAHQLGKHSPDQLNGPEEPQYQGVVFADGSAVMRWMTEHRSTSTWDNFESLFRVHGHPEYGTVIVWPDGMAPGVAEVVNQVAEETARRQYAADAEMDRMLAGVATDGTEPASSETLAVCLECPSNHNGPDASGMVVPFLTKAEADVWVKAHRDHGHEAVVTVPGWPVPTEAVAVALDHLAELEGK